MVNNSPARSPEQTLPPESNWSLRYNRFIMFKPPETKRLSFLQSAMLPLALTVWLVVVFSPHYIWPAELRVFGAASLQNALDNANVRYQRDTGRGVVVSYDGSDILAQKIENGAPADIFISADLGWMDYLAGRNLIRPETRLNFLGNKLVLIASAGRAPTLAIGPSFPLAQALGNGRLAIANPDSVPAGKYGKAALEALGVWASVKDRLAPARNVRAALALVSRREATLGIVYQTDAVVDPGVDIAGTFPASSHPPIVYPLAVTAASTNPAAKSYIAFLRSHAVEPTFGLFAPFR